MLVVLAILSLAYAIAMPGFRRPATGVELQAVAHTLSGHLRAARAAAIVRGKPTVVAFKLDRQLYATEVDGREFRFPSDMGVSLETAREEVRADGLARLVFYPDGSSTGGRISLQRDGRILIIGVEWLTGLVRQEPSS
jgi:general secretion pathway protein H